MQKARNVQYAAAGVQALPGMRMNVRSNVRLPDSEAGTACVMEQEPYCASRTRLQPPKAHVTIPARVAVLFLCGLFLVFGWLIVGKASQRAQIAKNISQIQDGICQTCQEKRQLEQDLVKAKDSVRICYEAVQRLGMIASTGVNSVRVVAPDTRPAQTAYSVTAAQETSPSAPAGMISGSR